jgi:hypothetical protein
LAQLASVHEIPALSAEETNTFKKDNAHQAAQQLIQQGNLIDAWKILLASQSINYGSFKFRSISAPPFFSEEGDSLRSR